MLAAGSPAFQQLYPFGATVHDRHGRRLEAVLACDPLTGEVVMMYDDRPPVWSRLICGARRFWRWDYWRWHICGGLPTRHGFWPAPLHIVPKPHWPGGPVPDGQAGIVGNGEREAFHP